MAPIVPVAPAEQSVPQFPPPVDQPDIRLVIEESDQPGSYVYKTLDRRTGEVLRQYPREELLRLRQEEGYEAGTVIQTEI
jgi:flagellar protein FlaG